MNPLNNPYLGFLVFIIAPLGILGIVHNTYQILRTDEEIKSKLIRIEEKLDDFRA